jgi:hypothetical protein
MEYRFGRIFSPVRRAKRPSAIFQTVSPRTSVNKRKKECRGVTAAVLLMRFASTLDKVPSGRPPSRSSLSFRDHCHLTVGVVGEVRVEEERLRLHHREQRRMHHRTNDVLRLPYSVFTVP